MKKTSLLLSSIALFALNSCTKEDSKTDNPGVEDTSILLKKITAGSSFTNTFTYNGNKIIKEENSDGTTSYTYTGDLITKIDVSYTDEGRITEYEYADGRLKKATIQEKNTSNGAFTTTMSQDYTYNPDGTILITNNDLRSTTPSVSGTRKITLAPNGNIAKEESFQADGTTLNSKIEYEYDDKNSPLKNVTGIGELLDSEISAKNNITKRTNTSITTSATYVTITTNVYTYNDKGYPTKVAGTVTFNDVTDPDKSEVTFEY